jgi:hypothetical protein
LKLFVIQLLIITLSIVSCSSKQIRSKDLLISDDYTFVSPESLTLEQKKKEINLIIHFLENGYGGRNFVPKHQFEGAITRLKSIQSENKAINQTDFCEQIDQALLLINDAHLMAKIDGEKCGKNRSHRKKIFVGQNIYTDFNPPWMKKNIKIKNKTVSVISITGFPKHEHESWNGFLKAVEESKNESHAIILDLRGNGGGDDKMGFEMAKILYGRAPPSSVAYQVKRQTAETMALLYNNYQTKILRLKSNGQNAPDYLVKRRGEAFKKFEQAQKGALPSEEKVFSDKEESVVGEAYNMPILVLIDSNCASSCESTLEFFETHPQVITMGTNSGGFVHFGNMGILNLPSSKIQIQMATDFWVFTDGRFIENIGYAPKIKLNEGQDAYKEAIKYLNSLLPY